MLLFTLWIWGDTHTSASSPSSSFLSHSFALSLLSLAPSASVRVVWFLCPILLCTLNRIYESWLRLSLLGADALCSSFFYSFRLPLHLSRRTPKILGQLSVCSLTTCNFLLRLFHLLFSARVLFPSLTPCIWALEERQRRKIVHRGPKCTVREDEKSSCEIKEHFDHLPSQLAQKGPLLCHLVLFGPVHFWGNKCHRLKCKKWCHWFFGHRSIGYFH